MPPKTRTRATYYRVNKGKVEQYIKATGETVFHDSVEGNIDSIRFTERDNTYTNETEYRVEIMFLTPGQDEPIREILTITQGSIATINLASQLGEVRQGDKVEIAVSGSNKPGAKAAKISYVTVYKDGKKQAKQMWATQESGMTYDAQKAKALEVLKAHPLFTTEAAGGSSTDEESQAEKDFWAVVDTLRLASHRQDEHAQVVLAYLDDQLGWDGIAWDSVSDQQFADAHAHMQTLVGRPSLPKSLKAVQYPEKAKPAEGEEDPFADE